jgi:DNA topoisomerase-2
MKENTIVKLTDREHVLKRQSMYLGSIEPIKHENIFLEDNKFIYKEYESVDGLLKIINEIIDNSVDEAIRTDFKFAKSIRVTVEDDKVTVFDDGRGIPIVKEKTTGEYAPVLAFTHAKAGSNFSDDDRTTAGMNGIGSFVANCFSKDFRVQTADGKNELRIHCKNNMQEISHTLHKNKKRFTQVVFKPDLKRFGMESIDDLHKTLIEQRLIHLAMCYPQIQFKYNKRIVKIKNTKSYLSAFSEKYVHIEHDQFLIAIMPNEFDDFRQTSFVNGLDICKGGNHTDFISHEIVSRLRDKIIRKYKTVKPGDIKNKIRIVTIFRGFSNVQFDSQTKERLTNSMGAVRDFLGMESKDWDTMARKILRMPEIYDPIIESFKIKEELKQRLALKELNKGAKKKKIRCEKYYAPIKHHKYLALCEGDSAASSIMSILGRKEIGYFAMRGVPLNSYEVKAQKLQANKELASIIQILGLQLGRESQENMTFENIILAQDADCIEPASEILMADGSYKMIKDIVHGDLVQSHANISKRVVNVIETKKTKIIKVSIQGKEYKFSEKHKLIIMRDGEIITIFAKDLLMTDMFPLRPTTFELDGYTFAKPDYIESTTHDSPMSMFDIEVEDDHTFFVNHKNGLHLLTSNCDGHHIGGLLIGFFQRYTPSLLENNRIKRLRTPIVVLKKKDKIIHHFFDLNEFKTFEKEKTLKGFDCEYKKGLGSWKKDDLKQLIDENGFDYFIEELTFDDQAPEIIHNWMSSKTSDIRKKYIQAVPFNSELV